MRTESAVIIGGGISGLAIARQLADSGLQVALLERGACCRATSNNSLRIIHGGFRYLQTLDFRRLVTSLADQTAVAESYPDLVQPLPCFMTLSGRGLKSRWPIEAASLVYSAFMAAQRSPLPRPRFARSDDVSRRVPFLAGRCPNGALEWHDLLVKAPSELGSRVCQAATDAGVSILEQQLVTKVREHAAGSFLVETRAGETHRAAIVVNAAGPWIRELQLDFQLELPTVSWCKGFNIVVSRPLDPDHALGFESAEGRLFFVVPRDGGAAIGTWYCPVSDVSAAPAVTESEIAEFLVSFNRACPGMDYSLRDVVAVDVGYLPMKSVGKNGPELFGSEKISRSRGYIEVMSTKYTTFRSQARAVSKIIEKGMTS